MADPWIKFYPTDWRSDPVLRLCSRAARGTWIDMLSIMHEATPYGELRVNGVILDARGLAKLLGESVDDIAADLAELEANGVFSRRKNGVIYSRRMERDENRRRKNRENGKKGGNPNLCNQREKLHPDNRQDKAQKPEARVQSPEKKKSSANRESVDRDSEMDRARVGRVIFSERFERLMATWAKANPAQNFKQAWDVWRYLDEDSRAAAEMATTDYFAACKRNRDQIPASLYRFLADRIFDNFVEYDDGAETQGGELNGSERHSAGRGGNNPGNSGMGCLGGAQARAGHSACPDAPARAGVDAVLGSEPLAAGSCVERRDVAGWGPDALSRCLGLADSGPPDGHRCSTDRSPARFGRHAATRH